LRSAAGSATLTRVPLRRAFAALVVALGLGGAGCSSCAGSSIERCGVIPPLGCPIGRGGTCEDPTCSGVYDCVGGDWVLVEDCAPTGGGGTGTGGMGGGATGGAGAGGGGTGGAGGACVVAALDHTGESDSCDPPLQSPDCAGAVAESLCLHEVCETGCVDFFLCKDEVWVDVAYCDEDGALVVL
jgi:hypothetical protein